MEPLGTPVAPSAEQPERRSSAEEEARAVADHGEGACAEGESEGVNQSWKKYRREGTAARTAVNQGRKDAQQSGIGYANSPSASSALAKANKPTNEETDICGGAKRAVSCGMTPLLRPPPEASLEYDNA